MMRSIDKMHGGGLLGMKEDQDGDRQMSDREYAAKMIEHHKEAVSMSNRLLAGSPSSQLKQFAEKVISVQSKEISFLQSLLK